MVYEFFIYLAELCNGELGNVDARRRSLPSLNNESQLQGLKEENAMRSLPPIEPAFNYDLSNPTTKSPINSSQPENQPESIVLQSQTSLETATLVNVSGSNSNTTNGNGCAIAIQVDEDYDEEENEDEISETVALTQKFDKSRMKKN